MYTSDTDQSQKDDRPAIKECIDSEEDVEGRLPLPSMHGFLTSKGLYNCVHLVLDLKEYYYLAGEYVYEVSHLPRRIHCMGPSDVGTVDTWS